MRRSSVRVRLWAFSISNIYFQVVEIAKMQLFKDKTLEVRAAKKLHLVTKSDNIGPYFATRPVDLGDLIFSPFLRYHSILWEGPLNFLYITLEAICKALECQGGFTEIFFVRAGIDRRGRQ